MRCPDSEAPVLSTRNATQLLFSLQPGLSHPPHDTSQFPVTDYLSGILYTTKKDDRLLRQKQLYPRQDIPKGRGSEAQRQGTWGKVDPGLQNTDTT